MIYCYCSTLELMKRHKIIFVVSFISVIIWTACSSANNAGQYSNKKFFVKPVCLSVNGIQKDISIKLLFEEAFDSHKIELITREDMLSRIENHIRVIGVRLKQSGRKFSNAEDVTNAVMNEMKCVANMLSINLTLEKKDDSLMIYRATWTNMPQPIDFRRLVKPEVKEINLTSLSYSLRENIYSIVDSILNSNELK